MFEEQLVMAWGCSLSWIECDGWISYPTSSDMRSGSVQRCVGIELEYHDRDSHGDTWWGLHEMLQWRLWHGVNNHGSRRHLMESIPWRCMPWYGELGGSSSLGRDIVEMSLYICCKDVCLAKRSSHHRWVMILVDGYWDGMLSRTTIISSGGGCKAFEGLVRRAPASNARERARGRVHGRADKMCDGVR